MLEPGSNLNSKRPFAFGPRERCQAAERIRTVTSVIHARTLYVVLPFASHIVFLRLATMCLQLQFVHGHRC